MKWRMYAALAAALVSLSIPAQSIDVENRLVKYLQKPLADAHLSDRFVAAALSVRDERLKQILRAIEECWDNGSPLPMASDTPQFAKALGLFPQFGVDPVTRLPFGLNTSLCGKKHEEIESQKNVIALFCPGLNEDGKKTVCFVNDAGNGVKEMGTLDWLAAASSGGIPATAIRADTDLSAIPIGTAVTPLQPPPPLTASREELIAYHEAAVRKEAQSLADAWLTITPDEFAGDSPILGDDQDLTSLYLGDLAGLEPSGFDSDFSSAEVSSPFCVNSDLIHSLGKSGQAHDPKAMILIEQSPIDIQKRLVVFADGSIKQMPISQLPNWAFDEPIRKHPSAPANAGAPGPDAFEATAAAFRNARRQALRALDLSQVKQLTLGIIMLLNDFNDVFPKAKDQQSFQAALKPYVKSAQLFAEPELGTPYVYVSDLGGKSDTGLENPSATPIIFESVALDGVNVAVGYSDGHAKFVSRTVLANQLKAAGLSAGMSTAGSGTKVEHVIREQRAIEEALLAKDRSVLNLAQEDVEACKSLALAKDYLLGNAEELLGGALELLERYDEADRVYDDSERELAHARPSEPRASQVFLGPRALMLVKLNRFREALARYKSQVNVDAIESELGMLATLGDSEFAPGTIPEFFESDDPDGHEKTEPRVAPIDYGEHALALVLASAYAQIGEPKLALETIDCSRRLLAYQGDDLGQLYYSMANLLEIELLASFGQGETAKKLAGAMIDVVALRKNQVINNKTIDLVRRADSMGGANLLADFDDLQAQRKDVEDRTRFGLELESLQELGSADGQKLVATIEQTGFNPLGSVLRLQALLLLCRADLNEGKTTESKVALAKMEALQMEPGVMSDEKAIAVGLTGALIDEVGNLPKAIAELNALLSNPLLAATAPVSPGSVGRGVVLQELALAYGRNGEIGRALATIDTALRQEQNSLMSATQKLDLKDLPDFKQTSNRSMDVLLSLASAPGADLVVKLAAAQWIARRKGAVLDAICRLKGARGADSAFGPDTDILGAVCSNMAPTDTLLEYARFSRLPLSADGAKPHDEYFLYVAGKDGLLRCGSLGATDSIDSSVKFIRTFLKSSSANRGSNSNAADSAPITKEAFRGEASRLDAELLPSSLNLGSLIVSPDGALNSLPFEVLIQPDGKYLVEGRPIRYVAATRDLLRGQGSPGHGVYVFSAPDFGDSGGDTKSQGNMFFQPLAGARDEGRSVSKLLAGPKYGSPVLFEGPKATRDAAMRLQAPEILHIASHAFVLPDAPGMTGTVQMNAGVMTVPQFQDLGDPLSRAGIAFAGCNTQTGDQSILTALDLSKIDLRGTELVTLSACDTGLGEAFTGEGVYGLRRGCFYAGAKSVLMSLFEVPDLQTSQMMQDFYSDLASGSGVLAATHNMQVKALERDRASGDMSWCFFVLATSGGK